MDNASLRIQGRADLGQATEHRLGTKASRKTVEMAGAIEDRQYRGRRTDGRSELVHGLVQRVGLHGDQNEIKGGSKVVSRDRVGSNGKVTLLADDRVRHGLVALLDAAAQGM